MRYFQFSAFGVGSSNPLSQPIFSRVYVSQVDPFEISLSPLHLGSASMTSTVLPPSGKRSLFRRARTTWAPSRQMVYTISPQSTARPNSMASSRLSKMGVDYLNNSNFTIFNMSNLQHVQQGIAQRLLFASV
jgi:hypothetical protein